jgi:hypothetical protein
MISILTDKEEIKELMLERKMQKHLDFKHHPISNIITEAEEDKEDVEEEKVDIKEVVEGECTHITRVRTSLKHITKRDFKCKNNNTMIIKRMITINQKIKVTTIIREEVIKRKKVLVDIEEAIIKALTNLRSKRRIMTSESIKYSLIIK